MQKVWFTLEKTLQLIGISGVPLDDQNHPDIILYSPCLKLRIVALQILSILVGAVPCERLFSALKNLIDSKSTKLTHFRMLEATPAPHWIKDFLTRFWQRRKRISSKI